MQTGDISNLPFQATQFKILHVASLTTWYIHTLACRLIFVTFFDNRQIHAWMDDSSSWYLLCLRIWSEMLGITESTIVKVSKSWFTQLGDAWLFTTPVEQLPSNTIQTYTNRNIRRIYERATSSPFMQFQINTSTHSIVISRVSHRMATPCCLICRSCANRRMFVNAWTFRAYTKSTPRMQKSKRISKPVISFRIFCGFIKGIILSCWNHKKLHR